MKKSLLICCAFTMIFFLLGCSSNQADAPKEKYGINGSVSLGAVGDNNLDRTKITYSIVISGSEEDIENITE